ncbi:MULTISPECIES: Rrf2 family transcriptional regulator [Leptospira]|uniref:Winged helix-turn-helix transcription repressor, HrcA DNA-binding family protein n=1 Tax=Leptospira johnsonii TaxID=1917820 RepID=A0A2P2CY61_9LEPT|nr:MULTISPECIES: Rrf2 family transcriptional regulator [Leptospira]TGM86654.1 Rrf2 family transcriptional regulator [Leptospira licerasiae]GBF37332.1 winged helix-turn-helix transcription repressor, HrcA DNA-binding family protein [Leptospira johnsonii]
MSIPSRYSIAIHILSLVDRDGEEASSSQIMADSIGTNPVVVRNILGKLKKAGLVVSKQGVAGAKLAKSPEEIQLLQIYKAVETEAPLFSIHDKPNPKCPVGKKIQTTLTGIFQEAQSALEAKLGEFHLSDVLFQLDSEKKKRA